MEIIEPRPVVIYGYIYTGEQDIVVSRYPQTGPFLCITGDGGALRKVACNYDHGQISWGRASTVPREERNKHREFWGLKPTKEK